PYCVFDNKTMEAIVLACPQTAKELLAIKGIGPKKLKDYGDDILQICASSSQLDTPSDEQKSHDVIISNTLQEESMDLIRKLFCKP
ncbi:MAG TPA: hypothetical protein EYO58_12875, partial [Flavobacteriales bacterium]|nr:hypothetical protein [Flavobacteriales bacterium]